jgi:phage terminase large subunit-like protein
MATTQSILVQVAGKLAQLPQQQQDEFILSLSDIELLALRYDWPMWARPDQLQPEWDWSSWGTCSARGTGKTRQYCEFICQEAYNGNASRIGLMAQNEDRVWDVLIEGESGILACSPPWFFPEVADEKLIWPNGAQAFVYTPEAPKAVFGPEHDLFFASEIHAWPKVSAETTMAYIKMGLRIGYARMIWDSNPQRRNPVLLSLIRRAEKNPRKHVLNRGSTMQNIMNLNKRTVEEWYDEYGDTDLGRMMLEGEMLLEAESALWKDEHIKRVHTFEPLARTVLGIDPAISLRKGTDATGMIVAGVSHDGIGYVLKDLSGNHAWEAWGKIAIAAYIEHKASCIVVERNRGGDACVANLRAASREHRDLEVILIGETHSPEHIPGTVWVKETISRQDKEARAQPIAAAYQRGSVYHVNQNLEALEDEMCSWDGTGDSPNRIDALCFAIHELLKLGLDRRPKQNIGALVEAQKQTTMKTVQRNKGAIVARMSRAFGGRI